MQVIRADSIDAATEQILDLLKANTSAEGRSNGNVIYFDGWEGLGASAVLRAVAQRLAMASEAPAGLQFEKIIQVDCSKWESKRALQRAVAEQLELPTEVMEMLDRQDEVDDYQGLDLGSRLAVPQVQRLMHRHIQELGCKFLFIFRNGGSEEIDVASFGFPLSEYLDNKVLWTFQGRFRLYPRIKIREALHKSTAKNKTDVFLSAYKPDEIDPHEFWSILVRQEAAEVAQQSMMVSTRGISIDQQAYNFILHILKLCCIGHHLMMDFDLATHASNYWICDGILHQLQREDVHGDHELLQADDDGDGLWQAADAFAREMLLDVDYYKYSHGYFPSHLLRVLKLSHRTFDFSSPPFAHCRNLKFLWLDSCHDDQQQGTNKDIEDPDGAKEMALQRCVGGVLVLHVLNTCCDKILSAQMMDLMTHLRELNVMGAKDDWDMGQLQGRLPSIRKLRVTKSRINCGGSSTTSSPSGNDDLFSGMKKMELFDFSGNHITSSTGMRSLNLAARKNLLVDTVIMDEGCVGLEQISFKGCANLKNLVLRGLFKELKSVDISGTRVKTLDLSAMAAPSLDELIALGCGKLCAILWPHETKRKEYLSKIRINTTTVDDSTEIQTCASL
ncbi:hypothetical protein PR202_gb12070 [Eleusine coracana subsp. coracana]|uniref:Uncharacterized protein n=1 Tax=Eleusine coracana subsp. coracana TaxID=191504 RepID=A0AAV5ENL3_ELECO|nr:hypothetical protein PR202_gb12070 [Eleusine coracana subsp. coracana]